MLTEAEKTPRIRLIIIALITSFVLHACAAFFSEGRSHPDADYQILEFANAKLGTESHLTLPWEFFEKIRPALQPAIALVIHQSAADLDPFRTAALLRWISALLGFASVWVLCLYSFRWLPERGTKIVLLFGTTFFWLLPYLHSRFSSEAWAGIFLALAIVLVDRACEAADRNRLWTALMAGLTLGLVFYLRFPTAFAILGIGLWAMIIARPGLKIMAVLACGFVGAVGINLVLDGWFYGEWTLTPWNYFVANLVEGRAASYGVDPWWYYLEKIFVLYVPPMSIVVIGALAIVVVLRPKHILTWTAVFFLVGHSWVGHKETRFLMPLAYPLLVAAVIGVQALLERRSTLARHLMDRRWAKAFILLCASLNGIAVAYASFMPASQEAVIHKWIYQQAARDNMNLVIFDQHPYHDGKGMISFFRSPGVHFIKAESEGDFDQILRAAKAPVYVFSASVYPSPLLEARCRTLALAASAIPSWVRRVDLGRWLADLRVWSIYRCQD